MLHFAIDVDGVIATTYETNAYGAYVAEQLGIPVDPNWRQLTDDTSLVQGLLRDNAVAAWLAEVGTLEQLHALVEEGQYSPIVQQLAIPVPGSVQGVHQLAAMGRIRYITNRKTSTRATTIAWLKQHGFPSPSEIFCCGDGLGFVDKMRYGMQMHNEGIAPLIFIDDKARYYEHTLRVLAKEDRELLRRSIASLAAINFGSDLSPCPFPLPIFPMTAVFDWSEMGQAIEQLLPFIGPSEHMRRAFLDPNFVPVAMRRTIDQRIVALTS